MKANKWPVAVLAVLGLAAAGDAMADWGHHHHGPRVEFGFVVGPSYYWGPWRYPPYYYYPPYYPPIVIEQTAPPVYIQQQPAQAPAPAAQAPAGEYWYYCAAANGYYPYVKECPAGWQKVAPTPPR